MSARGVICDILLVLVMTSFSSPWAGAQIPSERGQGGSVNSRRAGATDTARERYEGHLVSGDISFNLRIYPNGMASADWSRKEGTTLRYKGDYTGEEGNYAVKLAVEPATANGPSPLLLNVRSLGGMVTAQYTPAAGVPRPVAELRLMEVDAGDIKLAGKRVGASAGGNSAKRQTSSRNRGAWSRGSSRLNAAQRKALRQLGRSGTRR